MMIEALSIGTNGQGLYEITNEIASTVTSLTSADEAVGGGLCTVFLRHTSASLTIQENADPSARADLERWLRRLVPEDDANFTHTLEGPDDMPAHIKAALTATTLSIPFQSGRLLLGTWQGIYLWEHRDRPHQRELVVHCTP